MRRQLLLKAVDHISHKLWHALLAAVAAFSAHLHRGLHCHREDGFIMVEGAVVAVACIVLLVVIVVERLLIVALPSVRRL